MTVEISDEHGDDIAIADVGDGVPHLREAPDVSTERLTRPLVKLFQVMLCTRLDVSCHEVLDEDFLEIIRRINGILL